MAKSREGRGVKSFIPTWRGVVKILIVLVVLKVVVRYAQPNIPPAFAQWLPYF